MRELKFRIWGRALKPPRFIDMNEFICHGSHSYAAALTQILKSDVLMECQQYTGLKDINGKEIYEGDIVSQPYFEDWFDDKPLIVKGAVVYHIHPNDGMGNQCSGYVLYANPYKPTYRGLTISANCEVVGNIFENPELLKK